MLSIYQHDLSIIAVRTNNIEYSYLSFWKQVNMIADKIQSLHINRIMIDLPQSFNAYTLIWAAYIANCTFCCIKEDNPQKHKDYCKKLYNADYTFSNKNDNGNESIKY